MTHRNQYRILAVLWLAILSLSVLLCGCGAGTAPDTDPAADKASDTSGATGTSEGAGEANADTYTYDHIRLVLPQGFTVDESGDNPIAKCPEYPSVTDNISFSRGGADDIRNYSQSVLETIYRQTFSAFKGSVSYTETKIGGLDAIRYTYQLTMNGIDMTQTQIILFGGTYSNIVTFTSVSGNYDSAFDVCAASITVIH